MMGISLLSVPWAFSQSGLLMGLVIAFGMAIIAAYTAIIILKTHSLESKIISIPEFPQLCGVLMGQTCQNICSLFSLIALTGAAVVYWVLMSNFLYNTVTIIFDTFTGTSHTPGKYTKIGVYCPNSPDLAKQILVSSKPLVNFDNWWNLQTAPLFLLVIFPLLNFKSISFFTKFNSFGTITVLFLIAVVIYYASLWGININFDDVRTTAYVHMFKGTFWSMSGTLALGLFIHDAIITIVSNNSHPEHNCRDTYIAFGLVTGTYMLIGVLFYITFPLSKSCIQDNFLNNFRLDDSLTVICRALILFQMITVFPLVMFVLRKQAFLFMIGKEQDNLLPIITLNIVVLTTCILVASFYPSIGTILRFSGSISGFVILFLLPCLAHLQFQRKDKKLTKMSIVGHGVIMLCGFANLAAQFSFF